MTNVFHSLRKVHFILFEPVNSTHDQPRQNSLTKGLCICTTMRRVQTFYTNASSSQTADPQLCRTISNTPYNTRAAKHKMYYLLPVINASATNSVQRDKHTFSRCRINLPIRRPTMLKLVI